MSNDKIYEIVTEKIVAMLEEGTAPWQKPWNATTSGPRNIEGRPYRGVNVFLLLVEGMANGYASPYWMTYKQAQERGGTVKKGEKSTLVIFWKHLLVEDKDNPGKKKRVPMLRYFRVFNLDQTEGVKLPRKVQEALSNKDVTVDAVPPVEAAEAVIAGYDGAPLIREQGDAAWYKPSADVIQVPPRETFHNADAFYTTLFHEMGHSTGHASRCNRKGITEMTGFGTHEYGREELVAEMTSAFLSAETGIESQVSNNAAYLASWIRTIKEDVRAVVVAAGQAQRAADHILGRTFGDDDKTEKSFDPASAPVEVATV